MTLPVVLVNGNDRVTSFESERISNPPMVFSEGIDIDVKAPLLEILVVPITDNKAGLDTDVRLGLEVMLMDPLIFASAEKEIDTRGEKGLEMVNRVLTVCNTGNEIEDNALSPVIISPLLIKSSLFKLTAVRDGADMSGKFTSFEI